MSWELPEIVYSISKSTIDEWSDHALAQIFHFTFDMEVDKKYISYRVLKMADGESWLRIIIIIYMLLLYFVPLYPALYM